MISDEEKIMIALRGYTVINAADIEDYVTAFAMYDITEPRGCDTITEIVALVDLCVIDGDKVMYFEKDSYIPDKLYYNNIHEWLTYKGS